MIKCDEKAKNVVIPDGVTAIERGAFGDSPDIVSVKIPGRLEIIKYRTFCNCASLVSVEIASRVKVIEKGAFIANGHLLKSVLIPLTVTKIGSSAFRCCRALQSITIPALLLMLEKYRNLK